jgi:serine/threonine protein kinase
MSTDRHPQPKPGSMARSPAELSPVLEDPRVAEALEQYLAAVETGAKPNRQAFLARHAEIAQALAECLDGMEALHAAAAAAPSDQRSSAEGTRADTSADLQPEAPLGDFRIIREIGRGGMGVVYEAVQLSLGRRVALKVLPFAAALDGKKLQRFKNEAQAAAHLHHANIVPVYAVGSERGVHFYAMQLIEGQSLAALIEDLRQPEGSGTRNGARARLSPEPTGPYLGTQPLADPETGPPRTERFGSADTPPSAGAQLSTQRTGRAADFFRNIARLVAQAAEGLEYAHGLGIIHRDIKPANLLLDVPGNIWITDFGLAQFHGDASLTQSGDLLGTLRYMSPEQVGGQRGLIDHRTDVYSLGATLYELLTLRPIFEAADRQALMNQILYEEPRLPRLINRSIPAELETIVLKAIGKIPSERYATARELADDLQRFLSDRPIHARRPSLVEKTTKWARRHKAVVASAVVVLLLSVAALSAATVLIAGAYERERQKAQEADESFRQARQAVDQLVQISEAELAGRPFVEGLRKRLLETALKYYTDFLDQRRDDPSIRQELQDSSDKVETIIGELTELIGAGRYRLLQKPVVQDELGLVPDQREGLKRLEKRDAWHGSPGPEFDRRRLQLARDQETEVNNLLTQDQFRRFKQLVLQSLGPAAFREPDVISALKLTTKQLESIRVIEAELAFPGVIRAHAPPLEEQSRWLLARKAFEEARLSALTRIQEDVLTQQQAASWKEMTGTPLAGLTPGMFPGAQRHGPSRRR